MLVSDDPNELTQTPPDQIHQFGQFEDQQFGQNQLGQSQKYENPEDQFGQGFTNLTFWTFFPFFCSLIAKNRKDTSSPFIIIFFFLFSVFSFSLTLFEQISLPTPRLF
jgi:hypothetical protein